MPLGNIVDEPVSLRILNPTLGYDMAEMASESSSNDCLLFGL